MIILCPFSNHKKSKSKKKLYHFQCHLHEASDRTNRLQVPLLRFLSWHHTSHNLGSRDFPLEKYIVSYLPTVFEDRMKCRTLKSTQG